MKYLPANGISRRDWLKLASAPVLGGSCSWLPALAADAAKHPQRKRSCILLWMNGGPSTIDLWDLKPGHDNGGPYKEIATKVPGLNISEHLPKLAGWTDRMAVIRSMSTKEGEHQRASQIMRTGYTPQAGIQFPNIGALAAKELGRADADLPQYVCIGGRAFGELLGTGAGFLGPNFAPLDVASDGRVANLARPAGVGAEEFESRLSLLDDMDKRFAATRPGVVAEAHRVTYERAQRLMKLAAASTFNLDDEPAPVRDAYGRTPFGNGCLLARRLIERGVPFVEVNLENWDTHAQNFEAVKTLSQALDAGWSALMQDLKQHGLLDSTLIVWMGEFGRTPKINEATGRDHFPNAWSTVLAGGGIKGGSIVGKTSANGMAVEERPVAVADLLGTACLALGIDPTKQNPSNVGRPIRLVDPAGKAMSEIVAQ